MRLHSLRNESPYCYKAGRPIELGRSGMRASNFGPRQLSKTEHSQLDLGETLYCKITFIRECNERLEDLQMSRHRGGRRTAKLAINVVSADVGRQSLSF